MMKKKKKKKKKQKNISLSKRDKFLYSLFSLVIILMAGCVLCAYIFITDSFAFSDKNVLAVDNNLSILFILPFLFIFSITGIILTESGYSSRIPLVGYSKNQQYKLKNKSTTVPLLKKGGIKQYIQTKSRQQYARTIISIVVVLFTISTIFSFFGICKRTELTMDDQIISYNSFNMINGSANLRNAEKMTLSIQKTSRSTPHPYANPITHILNEWTQNWYFYIQMEIKYNDTEFTITPADFDDMPTEQVLEYMLHIKNYFPADKYIIRNIEYLDALQELKDYNNKETELLLTLFDQ